ncbi:6,7,8-trihydroxycoumarin synthase-like isoform X2 [Diospyros lotus]|uniref:6,7,8-trihydroxycoumarin synthase-like isoform X2 n=1 Tax=Diospyros lotus TaxID=55363 RepID=UPI00224EFD24|nr:6,7,8-trihydroxycoumarin synthase-like isoform X2 [Diospyros lotus]
MTMFLLLLLAIPIVFFVLQKLKQSGGRFQLPPGPPGLPFVGNLHQLDKSALCRHLWQLSKIYGPLMSLQLGSRPILVVSSAKMAKQFLKTHDAQFAGRPSMVGQLKLSYNGLDLAFAPFDDYWREMRKICNLHLFSAKRVQSFRSIREDEVSKMIKKINKLASDSKPINLSEILLSLTNTIICRIAIGKSYDDESCEKSRFHYVLGEIQEMLGGFFFSDYLPCMSWVDKLTGQSIRLERTFKALDGFSQQVIDEHLIDKKSGKIGGEDIIDVLLQLKDDGSSTIKLSMDHIKAVLMDIFAAGTDTNAATLVWIMTELVKNSEAMKKIQDEVRNIDTEKEILYETDLQHLPYLEAIVKETWRLHPPAPLLVPHETIQQCTIGPYTIQPKTIVFVNAWAIGRDPDSWEDPEEFLPSRFINSSIDFKGQNFELIPFGAGRRICPGIHLGVVMVELALANLVRSFNWEIPFGLKKEDIDTEVRPGITMHKKTPLCLLATKY